MPDLRAIYSTPPKVARRYCVAPETVLAWIRSGELHAIDVARRGCRRPRYRISEADLVEFEASRAVQPPAQPVRRRRSALAGIKQYY